MISLVANVINKNSNDMKEEILSIASDLREGSMTTNEAKSQLLILFGVSGSTLVDYEEETRNAYYCNSCGALDELDCCCEDEEDEEEDEEMTMLEIAGSCKCGAYRIRNNKVLHVADCVCGAD